MQGESIKPNLFGLDAEPQLILYKDNKMLTNLTHSFLPQNSPFLAPQAIVRCHVESLPAPPFVLQTSSFGGKKEQKK